MQILHHQTDGWNAINHGINHRFQLVKHGFRNHTPRNLCLFSQVHQVMLDGPSCSGQQLRHMPGATGRARQPWRRSATQVLCWMLSECLPSGKLRLWVPKSPGRGVFQFFKWFRYSFHLWILCGFKLCLCSFLVSIWFSTCLSQFVYVLCICFNASFSRGWIWFWVCYLGLDVGAVIPVVPKGILQAMYLYVSKILRILF